MEYNHLYILVISTIEMELEELFLKKEELPILHETGFQIPIHPRLLEQDLRGYENLAKEIFPKVAEDWYEDLKNYVEMENPQNKEQINHVYLKEKPRITKEFGRQYVLGFWEDNIWTMDDGFTSGFSISRNGGGTLYFNEGDENCRSFGQLFIKFSKEKEKEFEYERVGEFSRILTYAHHNIDYYPGALFLRNWAIMYMNGVFKEVFN